MYCELLADAVKRLKQEPVEPIPSAAIDLGFAAYIPKNYVPVDRNRMEVYRKIAVAKNGDDLKQIENELTDVYGTVPAEVKLVLELAELRIAASKLNIKSIAISAHSLVFSFVKEAKMQAESLFAKVRGEVGVADPKTVYLHLPAKYFESRTLINVLRKILRSE
jgi:transcription-repair coupling factor (superfamily II helicase)